MPPPQARQGLRVGSREELPQREPLNTGGPSNCAGEEGDLDYHPCPHVPSRLRF